METPLPTKTPKGHIANPDPSPPPTVGTLGPLLKKRFPTLISKYLFGDLVKIPGTLSGL
jgi:hypothetical protein